jgi:hypothetical protein
LPSRTCWRKYWPFWRIYVEGDQKLTKVIRLALLWYGGSIAAFYIRADGYISPPLAP